MSPDNPSNTALVVAAGLQLVGPTPAIAPLLPADAIRRGAVLLRAAHPDLAGLLYRPWFRTVCGVIERLTLPGISLHYALRKRILRDHARTAIAEGCTQVVVIGAGLDTLSMELKAAHPQLCCIEIDHPATQAAKCRGMEGCGQVHFIAADLAQETLGVVLGSCAAFRSEARTMFVAEGLLMYLPRHKVAALFAEMAAAAPDSRVAFTWFEPLADGTPNFRRRSRLVDFWLRLRSEPFLSGMPQVELARFLANTGFELDCVQNSIDMLSEAQRAELGPHGLPAEGEYICLAKGRGLSLRDCPQHLRRSASKMQGTVP